MSRIDKLDYIEKDAKVWLVSYEPNINKSVLYIYKDVPLTVWFKLNALYKASVKEFSPERLHGIIWQILRKYTFDKKDTSKLSNDIQYKILGMEVA